MMPHAFWRRLWTNTKWRWTLICLYMGCMGAMAVVRAGEGEGLRLTITRYLYKGSYGPFVAKYWIMWRLYPTNWSFHTPRLIFPSINFKIKRTCVMCTWILLKGTALNLYPIFIPLPYCFPQQTVIIVRWILYSTKHWNFYTEILFNQTLKKNWFIYHLSVQLIVCWGGGGVFFF